VENLPVTLENITPAEVFKSAKMDEILKGIKEHVDSIVPDVTTAKGRKEQISLAYKVSQSKTILDNLGKDLVAGKKAEIKLVDDERKKAREFLDNLRDKTRKPVTDWEEAEETRVEGIMASIERIKSFSITDGFSADAIQEAIRIVKAFEIGEAYEEFEDQAEYAMASTLKKLEEAHAVQLKYEQDQAELEALRKEKEEREAREEEERLAAEQKAHEERIRQEAAAEEARKAKEREDKLKAQKAKAQEDKRKAKAQAKKEKEERLAAEARAEQEKKEAAEKARQEEVARQQREAEERKAAEAQRKADEEHKAKYDREAAYFIKGMYGITEEQAVRVVDAISNNEVPHISIKY
jgi:hypothetical protein